MASAFEKYKMAEKHLQGRVEPLGYNAQIEPVATIDLFYSDGLVRDCCGKVVFSSRTQPYKAFVVFIPFYTMNVELPAELKAEFDMWSKHFETIEDKE